jgi:hypothetical protein
MLLEGVGVGFFDVFIILIAFVPLLALFIVISTKSVRLGTARYWTSEFGVPIDPNSLRSTSLRLVLPFRAFVASLAVGVVVVRLFAPPSPSDPYEILYFWILNAGLHLPALAALIVACVTAVAVTARSPIRSAEAGPRVARNRVPLWLIIAAVAALAVAIGVLVASAIAESAGQITTAVPFAGSPAVIFVASSISLLGALAVVRPWLRNRNSTRIDLLWNDLFATAALWMLPLTSLYASVTSIGLVLDLVSDAVRPGASLSFLASAALSISTYVFLELPTILAISVFLVSYLWSLARTLKLHYPDLYARSNAAEKAARWRRKNVAPNPSAATKAPAEEEQNFR